MAGERASIRKRLEDQFEQCQGAQKTQGLETSRRCLRQVLRSLEAMRVSLTALTQVGLGYKGARWLNCRSCVVAAAEGAHEAAKGDGGGPRDALYGHAACAPCFGAHPHQALQPLWDR